MTRNLAYLFLCVHQITNIQCYRGAQAVERSSARGVVEVFRTSHQDASHMPPWRRVSGVCPQREILGRPRTHGERLHLWLKPWERSVPDSDPDTGQTDGTDRRCIFCTAYAHISAGHTSTYRLLHICSNMNTKGEKHQLHVGWSESSNWR